MKTQYQFRDAVLAAALSCFAASATAQQSSQQQDLPTLSPTVHSARYPDVMCVHCRTVQSLHTSGFSPRQVCVTTDGTVWTLRYDLNFRDSADADYRALHRKL